MCHSYGAFGYTGTNVLAALDVHNEELANQCLSRIHHYLRSTVGEDSSSARIQRLVALQKESMEDYDGALALVDATASYLELVEASNNNNKKVEDKEVQVAKALLQFGVDRILKSYKGTSMFAVVKDAMDGCLELLTQS